MKSRNMCVSLKFLWPLRLCASAFSFALAFLLSAQAQPKAPADELASFHLADTNLVVELVAAEPDVVSPVAMCWDADGRMFVAEMSDYPMGPAGGKIKLLEDRDGDGRYERVTVFADKLNFPNGVLPWNGGVLVTAAPDILFLKDTDGDGRADERRVILTGFGQGNQQLRVNGLTWGLDNWVYGANGRSDGEVHAVEVQVGSDWAKIGASLARTNSIRGHDFRFRPGTGEFEAIAGRSQFGQTRDDWGNRFLSWNTMPIRHEVIPERYLKRNPHLDTSECVADLLPSDDTGRIFPLTPPPLVFNNESPSYYNALAGLTIFRGDALGEKYRGNAFMGEALRNLIHRRVLEPNGVTFIARRGETNSEFLASTDPWFHPVNFATAPDGALYFADFYRQFVEHPDYVHGEGIKEKVEWRTGAEHGRIWRIREKKFRLKTMPPNLTKRKSTELVNLFATRNGWWRDAVQRLLIERHDEVSVGALKQLVKTSPYPLLQIHALWTLNGLGAIDGETLSAALRTSDFPVLEHALRVAEPLLVGNRKLQESLVKLKRSFRKPRLDNPRGPLRVPLQFLLTLGAVDDDLRLETLPFFTTFWYPDRWETAATLSSVADKPWLFFQKLFTGEDTQLYEAPINLLEEALAELIGASRRDSEFEEFLLWITQPLTQNNIALDDIPDLSARVRNLARFAAGLKKAGGTLGHLLSEPPPLLADQTNALHQGIISAAFEIALAQKPRDMGVRTINSETERIAQVQRFSRTRVNAIRLLGELESRDAQAVYYPLLRRNNTPEVQLAVVKSLGSLDETTIESLVFDHWSEYSESVQQLLLSEGLRSLNLVAALLGAIEGKKLGAAEVDASARRQLLKVQSPNLKKRIEKLFKDPTATDRDRVVRDLQPALKLAGDVRRGAALFGKTCVTCHAVQGKGKNVGPDLSGIGAHPKETLLVDVFDPSRQVAPDYISQTITTTSGETVSGIITTESGLRVTLRQAGGLDETFVRSQIKEITADGKSLMPDGLEQGMSHQDVADLLEFLAHPDAKLLPEP
ncbi:MAG: c-type cytochrome [Verrucomicrobia bacterium]|nr:c-type cytochrome [Verrucomicrobiota bacterium]